MKPTLIACLVAFQMSAVGQMPSPLPEPPPPSDHLELALAGAQPVQDVSQRAALVGLLLRAFRQSNVRTEPYDVKTTFTSFGNSASDGTWKLQDTSPGQGIYRWTADGPSLSSVNLFLPGNLLYSNQPSPSLPLRLAQVRTVLFFKAAALGPRASLRSVSANLDGMQVSCGLISYGRDTPQSVGPRRWDESEYCVEPSSGNLITYSPVPGLYTIFDYSKPIHFHDKVIPSKFTITEGGKPVIEAQTESLTDPAAADSPLFQPNGLTAVGVGPLMTQPWRFRLFANSAAATAESSIVTLHGIRAPNAHLSELEVITATNPALGEPALKLVQSTQSEKHAEDTQPGATPESSEAFYTVTYLPAATSQ